MFVHVVRSTAFLFALAAGTLPPAPAGDGGGDLVPARGAHPTRMVSQGTETLIDGVLEAYGGLERIRTVEAYRLEATMQAHSRGQQARTIRISEGAERLQVMIRYSDDAEIRIIDGDRGYSGTSIEALSPAEGPALSAMTLQAARARLPWILDTMRARVTHVRTEGPYEVLEVAFSDTSALRLLIDTRTHRIMTTESMVRMGPMDIQFRTEFSDFREVDGVLFAFHEENFAAGAHTATTTVERVVLNPTGAERTLPRDDT